MEPFLREDQFERLYGLLQQEPKIHTKDCARERRFLEAVYWMGRSGAQWRFLPVGTASTSASPAGASWASGSGCSRRWRTSPTCRA